MTSAVSSAANNCLTLLTNLSIEANRVIWVHTVCHRGILNISADDKSRPLVAIGVIRVNVSGLKKYRY